MWDLQHQRPAWTGAALLPAGLLHHPETPHPCWRECCGGMSMPETEHDASWSKVRHLMYQCQRVKVNKKNCNRRWELLFYQASPGGTLLAHIHGVLSGKLCLSKNLKSRGKSQYQHEQLHKFRYGVQCLAWGKVGWGSLQKQNYIFSTAHLMEYWLSSQTFLRHHDELPLWSCWLNWVRWLKKLTAICLFWYAVVDQGSLNFSWQTEWRHQIGHSITKPVRTHVTFITARFLLPLIIRRVLSRSEK